MYILIALWNAVYEQVTEMIESSAKQHTDCKSPHNS